MSTPLERLLERIHPDRTIIPFSKRADDAINAFAWPSARVQSVKDFERVMADFYNRVWFGILDLDFDQTRYGGGFEYGMCRQILTAEYGDWVDAFNMARTGVQGGLYAVSHKVAQRLVDEFASNSIKSAISGFWHGLTADELSAATAEYIENHGYLWPPDMRDNNGLRIKARFHEVLARHPFIVRQLGELGR